MIRDTAHRAQGLAGLSRLLVLAFLAGLARRETLLVGGGAGLATAVALGLLYVRRRRKARRISN